MIYVLCKYYVSTIYKRIIMYYIISVYVLCKYYMQVLYKYDTNMIQV